MRHYKIALAVIEQGDNYLMQRRGNHPSIGAAGLVGFFGGKIEEREKAAKALCREVAEETNLTPDIHELISVGEVSIEMDHKDGRARVDAKAFSLNLPQGIRVEPKEWELVEMPRDQVRQRIDELTPATRAVFEEIIWH